MAVLTQGPGSVSRGNDLSQGQDSSTRWKPIENIRISPERDELRRRTRTIGRAFLQTELQFSLSPTDAANWMLTAPPFFNSSAESGDVLNSTGMPVIVSGGELH